MAETRSISADGDGDGDTLLRRRILTPSESTIEEGNGEGRVRTELKGILKDALRLQSPINETSVTFNTGNENGTCVLSESNEVSSSNNSHEDFIEMRKHITNVDFNSVNGRVESEIDSSVGQIVNENGEDEKKSTQTSAKRILKGGLGLMKRAFDTKPSKGRRTGFRRIDPAQARRIRDEIICHVRDDRNSSTGGSSYETIEEYEEISPGQRIQTTSSVRRKRRRRAEMMKKKKLEMLTFGRKKFEAEKILVIFCALFIVIGYPLCYYLQFYKKKT